MGIDIKARKPQNEDGRWYQMEGGKAARRGNQTASGQNRLGPSPDRWKLRSVTYPGIAAAMAAQWGK